MEDYLEAIALLKKEKGVARVRDVSRLLKVKTSSVVAALNKLSKFGLIVHERYGYIELTRDGEKLAQNVQERHNTLRRFLNEIMDIDFKIAAEDACKMEHSVSPQTFEKLTKFIEFVESCPEHGRPDWLKSFVYYSKTGKRPRCKIRQIKQRAIKQSELLRSKLRGIQFSKNFPLP